MLPIKRNLPPHRNPTPSKRRKLDSSSKPSFSARKWKPLSLPENGDWGGLLQVEELDDDDNLNDSSTGSPLLTPADDSEDEPEWKGIMHDSSSVADDSHSDLDMDVHTFDSSLLPNWPSNLHPVLLQSLYDRNFTTMTPIQSSVITSSVLEGQQDVVGLAPTGTGKTLAFGLPILHSLLSASPSPLKSNKKSYLKTHGGIRVLVLTPTRELANQIKEHFVLATTSKVNERKIGILSLTGGLSIQKQQRLLNQNPKPCIVIGSPGRIFEHLSNGTLSFDDLDHVVFDEFDKLFFAKQRGWKEEFDAICHELNKIEQTISAQDQEEGNLDESAPKSHRKKIRKWFFSATGDQDIMLDFRRRHKKKNSQHPLTNGSSTELIARLPFKLRDPVFIDVTHDDQQKVAAAADNSDEDPRIVESTIECLSTEKDIYLYVFHLLHSASSSAGEDQQDNGHGGKTLVFLNSVDGIRRLISVMTLLNIQALPLHSQMDQKARLKSLERFSSQPSSMLLTTDLASRGLDLPHVQNVISWNVPPTGEVYIHRIGRAARGLSKQGFSCVFICPEERGMWRDVVRSLGRQSTPPPSFPISSSITKQAKPRITLAKQIDDMQHRVRKVNHDKKWERHVREALEVDSDSSDENNADDRNSSKITNAKREKSKLAALKHNLSNLLSQRLVMPGVMTSFITSGPSPLVDVVQQGMTVSGTAVVGLSRDDKDARKKVISREQGRRRSKAVTRNRSAKTAR